MTQPDEKTASTFDNGMTSKINSNLRGKTKPESLTIVNNTTDRETRFKNTGSAIMSQGRASSQMSNHEEQTNELKKVNQ